MGRRRVLWLCSWYPNPLEPFNGDFIQRHARAAALFNDIHVIHLVPDPDHAGKGKRSELKVTGGLTEQRVFFKARRGLIGRIRTNLSWFFYYRQAVRNYLVTGGRPQLVHVHIPMKAGLIARWLKKRYRIPYVVTEHWGIYNDVLPKRFAKRSGIFRHLTRTIFEGSACFISVSRFLAEQVHRQVVPIQAQVIPNVVNTELFFPGTVLPSRFRFIHVSNMVPLKNAEGILRAFSRTKASGVSADLVMVGPAGKALRQLADSLGLQEPELRFTGEIPYEAVAAEMRSANALVLFSEMENAPCVIAEALCCGLPVIATRVGGIPELIDDRKGLLIPSRDETALVGALAHVFEEYGSYDRGGMAQEAAAAFNFRTVGASMDAAYRSITGGSEAISP